MPELPEVEAWRRMLDPLVRARRSTGRPCAHRDAEDDRAAALDARGRRVHRRRAASEAVPASDETASPAVMVHLMSAGRLNTCAPGGKGAKAPMFRVRFADGGELQLTEAGAKKRAGVWLLGAEELAAELAHLGPEADALDPRRRPRSSRRIRAACIRSYATSG